MIAGARRVQIDRPVILEHPFLGKATAQVIIAAGSNPTYDNAIAIARCWDGCRRACRRAAVRLSSASGLSFWPRRAGYLHLQLG